MFLFGGLELILPIAFLGLIVLAVVSVATGRRDPDPLGHRPYAIYLFTVMFVALFVTLFASLTAVAAIVRIALPDRAPFGFERGPFPAGVTTVEPVTEATLPPGDFGFYDQFGPDPDRQHTSQAVQAGLVAAAAALVLAFHAGRARELVSSPGFGEGPARRTHQSYLYSVCFVAVLTALFTAAAALYGLFRIIAPGTTGFGEDALERDEGIAQFVTAGLLAVASLGIFQYHWRRAGGLPRPAAAGPPPAAEEPPPDG